MWQFRDTNETVQRHLQLGVNLEVERLIRSYRRGIDALYQMRRQRHIELTSLSYSQILALLVKTYMMLDRQIVVISVAA